MRSRRAPALLPAAALAAGVAIAPQLAWLPAGGVAALAAAGLAAGRRRGGILLALAAGLAAGSTRDGEPRHDLGRPVAVEGRVAGHAVHDDGWRFAFDVDRLRQPSARGAEVSTTRFELVATLDDAGAPRPAFGARLRLTGVLSRSPGYANVARIPPGPWRLRIKSGRFVEIVAPPPAWAALATGLRAAAEDALSTLRAKRPGLGGALAAAVVLGDGSRLDDAAVRSLRRLGLLHTLAVSGLHVGLAALFAVTLAAPLGRRPRLFAGAAAVVLYLAVVGPRPSALRAAAMGLLATAALLLERPPTALNALAVAAAAMVLADPPLIDSLGFQLSVAATFGLLALAPAAAARASRRWKSLAAAAGASAGAQLATLPFLLPLAGGLQPLAPLLNLVAVPWIGAVLAGSFAATAAVALAPAAAPVAAAVLDVLAAPLRFAASWPAHPALFLPVAPPPALVAGGLGVALGVVLLSRRSRRLLLAATLLLACDGTPTRSRLAAPEAVFLDVGQGDATLLRDGGSAVLVDGGGWPRGDLGGRVVVPALARLGLRRLDAVVVTHGDVDHCRGLVDLAAYLPVGAVWAPAAVEREGCLAELGRSPGLRWRGWPAGERRTVGRWSLIALHPAPADPFTGNDASLVLRAEAAGVSLLLTGDLGAAAERALVARLGEGLRSDVLKVAHHGSAGSSTEPFLRRVRPRLAVVSAGAANPYGHPAPAALARLRRSGARVLRTDRDGAVHLALAPGRPLALRLPGSPRAGSATIDP